MTVLSHRYHAIIVGMGLLTILVVMFLMTLTANPPTQQNYHRDRRLMQLKGRGRIVARSRDLNSNSREQLRNAYQELSKIHRRKDEAIAALRNGKNLSLHNSTLQTKPLTFYSIFAGRPASLEVQMPYIQQMLNEESIDEVHLWDFTCKQYTPPKKKGKEKIEMNYETVRPPTKQALAAAQFLRETMLKLDPRIFVIKPRECIWEEYYGFYERFMRESDVLIKADDDIVFVDTNRVSGFIHSVRKFPEVFLWSANVINNGISAALQGNDGLLPRHMVEMDVEVKHSMTKACLYRQPEKGRKIHKYFLSDPQRFLTPIQGKELRLIRGRLSINFIAFLGKNIGRAAAYVERAEGDDEAALTKYASEGYMKEKLVVYMPLVASHGSFGPQHIGGDIYEQYRNNQERLKSSNRDDKWEMPHDFQLPVRSNM